MSSTLSPTADLWTADLPTDLDRFPSKLSSLRRRASRAFARFLITFCIGVAATLAWQSYGDAARAMVAGSSAWLSWLAPQAAPVAQSTPVAPSADKEQFKAMLFGLAAMRQRVDQIAAQIAAGEAQTTRDIATKLEAAKQDILDKISTPAPQPASTPAPVRKPLPAAQAAR
ncbi:MAG TPA: hypothetical protein VKP67_24455 [Xanthobacteraceae bacterium]|nr:hypothetical protein [Xanthobacteraceae bacterium]